MDWKGMLQGVVAKVGVWVWIGEDRRSAWIEFGIAREKDDTMRVFIGS